MAKKKRKIGSIKPASGYQTGHRSKIKDMDKFIKLLQENEEGTAAHTKFNYELSK